MQGKGDIVLNFDAAPQKSSSIKKPIIITVIIVVVMLIIGATVIMLAPKADQSKKGDETAQEANYTDMQKLFLELIGKEVVIEFMAEDYFKNDQFATVDNEDGTGKVILPGTSEYIQYNIVNEEEDSPDTAIDFVYHETVNDRDTFIMQSGENTYQYFNGSVTEEYDNLKDAINYHLLFR